MEKIVTMDLGSNSFRVLIYDTLNFKIISEFNEIVGMADGLEKTNKISIAAQNRVIKAINKCSQDMNFDSSKAICITTAAMRKADNSQEVLKNILDKTKASFKIIDGLEEARLTLLAVKYALKREKILSENFILLDIGGGSTEIIINTKDQYISHSFDLGIVTLTQKYYSKKDLELFLEDKKVQINNFLLSTNIDISSYTFVATAGTPTTIAAIKLGQDFFHYNKDEVNGTIVDLNDLNTCLEMFEKSTSGEITDLVGKGRVDFIEIGIHIYKAIFEVLEKKESLVLDDGLKEGIAINYAIRKA
ncbi:MAG: exopolyphosphatase [Campylobacteraceae bacterium]|nr:exopolyphosphatase [Campylobacteraceae bacterium]